MKCINCGNELPDASVFCNVCGAKQSIVGDDEVDLEKENKKVSVNEDLKDESSNLNDTTQVLSKKRHLTKQLKIAIALCFSVLLMVLIFSFLNNPVNKFVKAVESGNEAQAKEIFNSEINSENELSKLVSEIDKEIDLIYNAYISESITYDDAKAQTLCYSSAVSTAITKKSQISETISKIESANDSKVSYITGKQYLEKSDYVNAINMFLKVVKDDKNYQEAQSIIKEIKPKYREILLKEIKDLSSGKKYSEALNLIEDGLSVFNNDKEFSSLKQSLTTAQSNYIAEQKKVEEEQKKENAKKNQQLTVEKTKVLVQSEQWKGLYPDLFSVIIRNNSGKTVKSYQVAMLAWDINGYPLKIERFLYGSAYEYGGNADNVNVLNGDTGGSDAGWDLQENHRIAKTKAVVVEAEFYDGTSWKNPYYEYFIEEFMGKTYVN